VILPARRRRWANTPNTPNASVLSTSGEGSGTADELKLMLPVKPPAAFVPSCWKVAAKRSS
jgi:hypothetical protein